MTSDGSRGPERMVTANGVRLCVQAFGVPADPAVLLIGGAAASMDWWDEAFCERLAAGHRYVIRYDHRDTGRSVSYQPGHPGYTGPDLVADAVGVLDALGVERAHLVGISMGGALAQCVAIDHPELVDTLTLISTSAAGPIDATLPPMAERLRRVFAEPNPDPDWSDRNAVIDHIVEGERPFAGSYPFEEERVRATAARIVDRTENVAAGNNHWALDSGDTSRYRPERITAPTLVLHGTEDELFPYGHGEALAGVIPDARLIPLERVGHQMPPRPVWDVVVPAILGHTERGPVR